MVDMVEIIEPLGNSDRNIKVCELRCDATIYRRE
jgi:hypothetical protein